MPLTSRGRRIMASMRKTYKSDKKAEGVFYAMRNSGKLKDVDKPYKRGFMRPPRKSK